MNESSTASIQRDSRHRTPALLGLLALALLQISIAIHQFEHVDSHSLTVCQLCSAFSELDDVTIDSASSVGLPVQQDSVAATVAHVIESAASVAPYWSRAPPHS
jgi:hypothetical protein